MPRPIKCRKVCSLPINNTFFPVKEANDKETIILNVDEYETIRLIDLEGFSQEECGERMGVARTTVQQIYTNGRKKLAEVLVYGTPLRIEGGAYCCCNGEREYCGRAGSCQYYHNEKIENRGGKTMKIAVTYEDGQVFQHFGHTEKFCIYNVENKTILGKEVIDTNGQGHGALAGFLKENAIDALICGGIGGGAKSALDEAGITLYSGVSGSADDAVSALLEGQLNFSSEAVCNHHDHHGDHNCGNSGCGHH